jgi:hypothetical protein
VANMSFIGERKLKKKSEAIASISEYLCSIPCICKEKLTFFNVDEKDAVIN